VARNFGVDASPAHERVLFRGTPLERKLTSDPGARITELLAVEASERFAPKEAPGDSKSDRRAELGVLVAATFGPVLLTLVPSLVTLPGKVLGADEEPRVKKPCATRQDGGERFGVLDELEPFLPGRGESMAIIGVTQCGKTTLAWKWAEAMKAARVRTLSWDPCFQWGQDGQRRDDGELGPMLRTVTVSELEEQPELLLERNLSMAVRPTDVWAPKAQIAKEFARFAEILIRSMSGGRLALFVDECNVLTPHAEAAEVLDDMAERWGKEGIVPFFVTQRWTHLGVNVRAEVAWLLSFHQNKTSDLRQLSLDAGQDFARAVGELPPHHYRARYLRRALPEALASLG
jgi:hypothetical protein